MTEELLNALKVIKAECEKHSQSFYTNCEECPICNTGGDCGITEEAPRHWRLEKREVYF